MNEREQLIARLRRLGTVLDASGGAYATYDTETCELAIAALSAPHANNAPVSVHPMLEPTHICKDCGVPWRQCDDFTFNLRGAKACPACDNTPVGGHLVSITAPLVREINRLRALSAPPATPVAWGDDACIAGKNGDCAADAVKAHWLCGNWKDQAHAKLLKHPLYAAPQPPAEPQDVQAKYNELLYAVGKKYPGETRHQTALRYIQRAEAAAAIGAAQREGEA